jgi:GT2 family glycosyltransferase
MKVSNIAILFTSYNRREKTINFLESLMHNEFFDKFNADIYMLDDGSTDGTGDAVREKFPHVNMVTGTGNLFWAGGMRKIWRHALAQKEYDVFLLFNDDVVLMDNAVDKLIDTYIKEDKTGTILIGSTLNKELNKLSYGGSVLVNKKRSGDYVVLPDETKLIPCDLANANILLVDKLTVEKQGIFSDHYVHSIADYDYTLTAKKNGINLLIAPGYYAYCENDHGVNWLPGSVPLKKRIEYLYSKKGLTYKEFLHYTYKHFPFSYPGTFIKLWMKTLFPIIWEKFKDKEIYK